MKAVVNSATSPDVRPAASNAVFLSGSVRPKTFWGAAAQNAPRMSVNKIAAENPVACACSRNARAAWMGLHRPNEADKGRSRGATQHLREKCPADVAAEDAMAVHGGERGPGLRWDRHHAPTLPPQRDASTDRGVGNFGEPPGERRAGDLVELLRERVRAWGGTRTKCRDRICE